MTIPGPQLVPDAATSRILRDFDFDRNPTPMWVFDARSFAFLAVNDAAVDSYGYSRQEFLARTILDIRPSKDIVRLVRRQLKGPVKPSVGEIWTHEKKDHSLIDVKITSHQILFNGHSAEIVTATAVSRRREPADPDSQSADHLRETHTLLF
jgi:PAS domain S-box-containing protein